MESSLSEILERLLYVLSINPFSKQRPREQMEEKLRPILDRLQSVIDEIRQRSLWLNVYVIRRSQLDRLQSLREEICRILETVSVNFYEKRGCQLDRLQSFLEEIFDEALSTNFHVIERWDLEHLQSLIDEIHPGASLVNSCERLRRFETEPVNLQVKRLHKPDRIESLYEEIRRESLLVNSYEKACRLNMGSVPAHAYHKRCRQLECLREMLEEIRHEARRVVLCVNLIDQRDRLSSMLAQLQQIRESFWMNLREEILSEAYRVNLYEKNRFESLSANWYETIRRQLDRLELLNDATESLEDHSMDNLGPPPGGGGLQQQRPLLHYTEVRRGRSMENRDVAPNVQTFPGVLKSKTFEVKKRADEPRVQVSSGVLKDKTFEKKDEANEYRSDEPNTQAYQDDVKVQGETRKPNVLHVGRYKQILAMTFAFLLPVANSNFLEVPKNAVLLQWGSPESVEMACKSDCQCDLKWFVNQNDISKKEILYNGYRLSSSAAPYCTVLTTDEPGKCYLNLTNKPEAAQTYICFEPGTLAEASADLIWIGDLISNDSSTESYVNLTCSVEFRGNWAPTMEWKEHSSHGEKVLSVGVITATLPNQRVTSKLVMEVQNGSRNYSCATKFDINGKPNTTTATNVPDHNQNWTSSAFIKSRDEMKTEYFVNVTMVLLLITLTALALGIICIICAKRGRGHFATVFKYNGRLVHEDRPIRNTENEVQIRKMDLVIPSTQLVQADVEEVCTRRTGEIN